MNWDVLRRPDVVHALDGLTPAVGLQTPTGEAWTLRGTEVEQGLASDVDFVVQVTASDLVSASAHVELAPVEDTERFHLLCRLMGPILQASAVNRHLWSWPYRTGQVYENVLHFTMSTAEAEVRFTWLAINEDWLWLEGHHATPLRSIDLDLDTASELLRSVLRATREDSVRAWTWFTPWWLAFREAHSTLHVEPPPRPEVEHVHGHDCGCGPTEGSETAQADLPHTHEH